MNTISLLLVDQLRVIRELLADLFNAQPDLHVVGQTSDAEATLLRVRDFSPVVVVLGMVTPDDDRMELVRSIRRASPPTRVVVMDVRTPGTDVERYREAGAHGFILKDTPIENMLHMIRIVVAGTQPESVADGHARPMPPPDHPVADLPVHLTKRELEIAQLISQGRSNKEMARELRLSEHTVKTHVRRITEKLALHSRVQIAAYAYGGYGLAPPDGAHPRH
jgi:DNA-binding NarL/FixJ family response regulator